MEHVSTILNQYAYRKSNGCFEEYNANDPLDPYIFFRKWISSFVHKCKCQFEMCSTQCRHSSLKLDENFESTLSHLNENHWLRVLILRALQMHYNSLSGRSDGGVILSNDVLCVLDDVEEISKRYIKLLNSNCDRSENRFGYDDGGGGEKIFDSDEYFVKSNGGRKRPFTELRFKDHDVDMSESMEIIHIDIENEDDQGKHHDTSTIFDAEEIICLECCVPMCQNTSYIMFPELSIDFQHYFGNLFFNWWRNNKEILSVHKYLKLLNFHATIIQLTKHLQVELAICVQTHVRNFSEIINIKKEEVMKYFLMHGDRIKTVSCYKYYVWSTKILSQLQEQKNLIFNYQQVLDLQHVLTNELQASCNSKNLFKTSKESIISLFRNGVVEGVINGSFVIKTWITEIMQTQQEKIQKINKLILVTSTARHHGIRKNIFDGKIVTVHNENTSEFSDSEKKKNKTLRRTSTPTNPESSNRKNMSHDKLRNEIHVPVKAMAKKLMDLGFDFVDHGQQDIYKIVLEWQTYHMENFKNSIETS